MGKGLHRAGLRLFCGGMVVLLVAGACDSVLLSVGAGLRLFFRPALGYA